MNRAGSAALLGVLVAGGMGVWWLFGSEAPHARPLAGVRDDLEVVAALFEGGSGETAHDVLVAAPEGIYLARASDRTITGISPVDGSKRVMARLDAPAEAMALAGGALWVAEGHAIEKIPTAGGEPQTVATGLSHPRSIAADGRWLFVVDAASSSGLTRKNTVVRVPVRGGERSVVGSSDGEISDVVLGETDAYWADRLEGSIVSVAKTGGDPRILATDRGLPGSLALQGDMLVWVEKRSESLWTMPAAGGVPRRLVQDFAGFASVVVGARGVYWTNEAAVDGSFRVLTVGKDGDAQAVSGPSDAIDALASDGSRLYWDRDGVVGRVPAP